jgi:hypothetical protein
MICHQYRYGLMQLRMWYLVAKGTKLADVATAKKKLRKLNENIRQLN